MAKLNENQDIESVMLLPMSLQKMIEVPNKHFKRNQAMTMKELDCKLNALRRENFDLKLRLYLEKQNKGPLKPGNVDYLLFNLHF
jgi:microtubule associated